MNKKIKNILLLIALITTPFVSKAIDDEFIMEHFKGYTSEEIDKNLETLNYEVTDENFEEYLNLFFSNPSKIILTRLEKLIPDNIKNNKGNQNEYLRLRQNQENTIMRINDFISRNYNFSDHKLNLFLKLVMFANEYAKQVQKTIHPDLLYNQGITTHAANFDHTGNMNHGLHFTKNMKPKIIFHLDDVFTIMLKAILICKHDGKHSMAEYHKDINFPKKAANLNKYKAVYEKIQIILDNLNLEDPEIEEPLNKLIELIQKFEFYIPSGSCVIDSRVYFKFISSKNDNEIFVDERGNEFRVQLGEENGESKIKQATILNGQNRRTINL